MCGINWQDEFIYLCQLLFFILLSSALFLYFVTSYCMYYNIKICHVCSHVFLYIVFVFSLYSLPSHVRVMCESCASHVRVMCESCASHVRAMCEPCASHVRAMCEPCASHVRAMCEPCASHVRVTCESCVQLVLDDLCSQQKNIIFRDVDDDAGVTWMTMRA